MCSSGVVRSAHIVCRRYDNVTANIGGTVQHVRRVPLARGVLTEESELPRQQFTDANDGLRRKSLPSTWPRGLRTAEDCNPSMTTRMMSPWVRNRVKTAPLKSVCNRPHTQSLPVCRYESLESRTKLDVKASSIGHTDNTGKHSKYRH